MGMICPRRRWTSLLILAVVALAVWKNFTFSFHSFLYSPQPSSNQQDTSTATSKANILKHPSILNRPKRKRNIDVSANATKIILNSNASSTSTIILTFADWEYGNTALKWYQRLEFLGYNEHFIVTIDEQLSLALRRNHSDNVVRWVNMPYTPCKSKTDKKPIFRLQLFALRWKFIYEQLKLGQHVLLSDADNAFWRFLPMRQLEDDLEFDIFLSYAAGYPERIFDKMGFTICGCLVWLRSNPRVLQFVENLLFMCGECFAAADNDNTKFCECACDDQVKMNELLYKDVKWDRRDVLTESHQNNHYESLTGTSQSTNARIKIWDRNLTYRGDLPKTCPTNNWVGMPGKVLRQSVVNIWYELCSNAT